MLESQETQSQPVLREEVEEAVHSLKAGKSPGVDTNSSELLNNGCEATTTALTATFTTNTQKRQSQAMLEL